MRGLLIGFATVLLMVGMIAVVTSAPDDGIESGTDAVPADQERGVATIRGRAFEPATIRALPDSTVTFRNSSGSEHGVQFERGGLRDAMRIRPGGVATMRTRGGGRYPFVCPIHPEMRGTVVVQPSTS